MIKTQSIEPELTTIWDIAYFFFTLLFLIDLIIAGLVYQKKLFANRPEYKWELFLQVFNLAITIWYLKEQADDINNGKADIRLARIGTCFVVVSMLRLIVLVRYFMVVRDIRIIVYTIRRLAQPFMSILFAFYLITYEYIVVG